MKKIITLLIFSLFLENAYAGINPLFLHGDNLDIDKINSYLSGTDLPPGKYNFTFFVNSENKGKMNFTVKEDGTICKELKSINLFNYKLEENLDCGRFEEETGSKSSIDFEREVINFKIEEKYLNKKIEKKDIINGEQENIISGAYLNLNVRSDFDSLNGSSFKIGGNIDNNQLEIKFENRYDKVSYSSSEFNKPIYLLNSNLKIGDFYTSIGNSDSAFIRGVQLKTDRDFDLRSYDHIAYSGYVTEPSEILIFKDNKLIKSFYVQPGNYNLDEAIGNLGLFGKIVIKEKSESGKLNERDFYITGNNLLRFGEFIYQIDFGDYIYDAENTGFFHGGLQYGFSTYSSGMDLTLAKNNYKNLEFSSSVALSSGTNFSFSINHSIFNELQGNSYNLSTHSSFFDSDVNFSLSTIRYDTGHYLSLSDSFSSYRNFQSRKYDFSSMISYDLKGDNLSASYNRREFRNTPSDSFITLSYGKSFNIKNNVISTNVTYSSAMKGEDDIISLNVSIPLGFYSDGNHLNSFNLSMDRVNTESGATYRPTASISGVVEEANAYAFVSDDLASVSVSRQIGHYANMSIRGSTNNTKNVSLKSSIAYTNESGFSIQPYELRNPLLVHAEGFEGEYFKKSLFDSQGYAVVDSHASRPYQKTKYVLDTNHAPLNVEVYSDYVKKPFYPKVFNKAVFQTEKQNYYFATFKKHNQYLDLGTEVMVNNRPFFVQSDGSLLFNIKSSTLDDVIFDIGDGSECKADIELNQNIVDNTIPDIGEISCD